MAEELDETQANNKKSLKYFIVFVIKPELRRDFNFKAIKTGHIIANKKLDTIHSEGVGIDKDSGIEQSAKGTNVLKLSENPNYEQIFLGLFIDQIKDFGTLYEADLRFEFMDKLAEDGKTVLEKKHLNTCIKFFSKSENKPLKQNFRSEF